MATICESCGHRTNEIKSCAGIEEKGIRIKIHIKDPQELSYDVVKVCIMSSWTLSFYDMSILSSSEI